MGIVLRRNIPVKDGSLAESTVKASSITDRSFLKQINQKFDVNVFSQGTVLLIALNDSSYLDKRIGRWPDIS